jgi:nicotinate-nucleotide adenylyltransferase
MRKSKGRLGIFGGTFNPVHIGHLIAAQEVREKMRLSRVIFVPSAYPPHKIEQDLASARHRLNMLKLAIDKISGFSISTLEIERGGKSYSVDTMRQFKKQYSKTTKFFFILGIDAAAEIFTWKEVNNFLRLCKIIAVNRPGLSLKNVSKKPPSKHIVSVIPIGISSSLIRKRITEGKPINYLVPEKVEKYIKRHKLYT